MKKKKESRSKKLRSHIRTVNAENIYNIPLCKYRQKEKTATVQYVHTSYMYTCEYVSGKLTDSSPRNRFKTSPYYYYLLLLLKLLSSSLYLPISHLSLPTHT